MKQKIALLTLFTLITSFIFSQRKVTGVTFWKENRKTEILMGTKVTEMGTANFVYADTLGNYKLNTLQDTCTLSFEFVGLVSKQVKVLNDTIINIILPVWNYRITWFTTAINFDMVNSMFGVSVSNGYDEYPIIHFEDFSSNFMCKFSAQTNFERNFTLDAKLAFDAKMYKVPIFSTEVSRRKLSDFNFLNVELAANYPIPRVYSLMHIKVGYQQLNEVGNYGVNLGFQKSFRNFYSGFSAGYYFDYFNYLVYAQSKIMKKRLSCRMEYERIKNTDFFNIGIHYTVGKSSLIE